MAKEFIESFKTSSEAWAFITNNYKTLGFNSQKMTLTVEKRSCWFWVVLKRK